MKKVMKAAKDLAESAGRSVVDAAGRTTNALKEHAPSAEQMSEAKSLVVTTAKSVGEGVRGLATEVIESKPFRNGAKGALVGAVVAVPLPVIGPMFGAAVGAVMAVYFGGLGREGTDKVPVPREGSDLYLRLRELDDLRQRKILNQAQFEEQVQAVLGSYAPPLVIEDRSTPVRRRDARKDE